MSKIIYPIGGFAPGYYQNACVSCKQVFQGDKLASQCEPCAINTINQSYQSLLTRVWEAARESAKMNLEWRDTPSASQNMSFRCLIKFKEVGMDGNPHVSTGYWWHIDSLFSIDNKEMEGFTPVQFALI